MILVLNPGSSSLKYKLFDTNLDVCKSGNIDVSRKSDHKDFRSACRYLFNGELSVYNSKIFKIGIRVVHGGSFFNRPTLINKEVLKKISLLSELAPLHNLPAIEVINNSMKFFKEACVFAFFDTSFFLDLPKVSITYAIPNSLSSKYNIRRFGFHGISHQYVKNQVDAKDIYKVISVHLGSGCSITAINKGKVIDTSMGFTPDEGLVMHTRSGDLDPGLVLFLVKKFGYKKTKEILETESGLFGFCGGGMLTALYLAGEKIEKPDFKPKIEKSVEKERLAKLALDIYIHKIKKYIGAYSAEMSGVDIIAFTGSVGAGSSVIRDKVMEGLGFLRYTKIDVIKPNEELAIAQELILIVNKE